MKSWGPALTVVLALATVLAVFAGDGNVAVALTPLLGAGIVWFFWRYPLRYAAIGITVVTLVLSNSFEVPFSGAWHTPLHVLDQLWFENLHKFTGVGAMRFSLLTLCVVAVIALGLFRQIRAGRRAAGAYDIPLALKAALALTFVTCVWLEMWGLARGGDFKQSLWQFQQLLFLPLIAAMYTLAMRGPQDLRAFGWAIVGSALFKVLEGAYFLYFIARPQGIVPAYVTSHSDSVLFVVAFMVCAAQWLEAPSRNNTLLCLAVMPVLTFGIAINDRRLAYVSLGACLAVAFLLAPPNRAKRFLARGVVFSLPLLLMYPVVGWNNSYSRVFKPVQVLRSIVAADATSDSQADSSTEFREIENWNLIRTWDPNPVLGSGFGHEYDEAILLPDISHYFPAYRYVPHNGVLWLWGIGGFAGFTMLFMFLVVGVMVTARAYRASRIPEHRAGALVCVCVCIAYLNQAFGDMGTQNWNSAFLLAAAMVFGGKLAIATGAWPAHLPARTKPALASAAQWSTGAA